MRKLNTLVDHIISEKLIRKTNKGRITQVTFTENHEVKSEYCLYDNRDNFLQTIRTPFRVAEYL